jgi:hypothetical protein
MCLPNGCGPGIESCYLALYENPANSIEWFRPRWPIPRAYAAPSAYPSLFLPPAGATRLLPARRYSLLVESSIFRQIPLASWPSRWGLDGDIYEVLRGHISSAQRRSTFARPTHSPRCRAGRPDQNSPARQRHHELHTSISSSGTRIAYAPASARLKTWNTSTQRRTPSAHHQ